MEKLSAAQSHEQSLRLLREYHQFPGPYVFKLIGPACEQWREQAALMARALAAEYALAYDDNCLRLSRRQGQYVSLSLTLEVAAAEQVLAIYAGLRRLTDLKMLV
jgi:putative lipoic acid-binding regulatory protein